MNTFLRLSFLGIVLEHRPIIPDPDSLRLRPHSLLPIFLLTSPHYILLPPMPCTSRTHVFVLLLLSLLMRAAPAAAQVMDSDDDDEIDSPAHFADECPDFDWTNSALVGNSLGATAEMTVAAREEDLAFIKDAVQCEYDFGFFLVVHDEGSSSPATVLHQVNVTVDGRVVDDPDGMDLKTSLRSGADHVVRVTRVALPEGYVGRDIRITVVAEAVNVTRGPGACCYFLSAVLIFAIVGVLLCIFCCFGVRFTKAHGPMTPHVITEAVKVHALAERRRMRVRMAVATILISLAPLAYLPIAIPRNSPVHFILAASGAGLIGAGLASGSSISNDNPGQTHGVLFGATAFGLASLGVQQVLMTYDAWGRYVVAFSSPSILWVVAVVCGNALSFLAHILLLHAIHTDSLNAVQLGPESDDSEQEQALDTV